MPISSAVFADPRFVVKILSFGPGTPLDTPEAGWHPSPLPTPQGSGVAFPMTVTPTFEATVIAELPQQLYRLETSEGQLVAGPSEECKRLGVFVRTGQRVLVRRASLDPGRGVILGLAH